MIKSYLACFFIFLPLIGMQGDAKAEDLENSKVPVFFRKRVNRLKDFFISKPVEKESLAKEETPVATTFFKKRVDRLKDFCTKSLDTTELLIQKKSPEDK